MLARPLSYACSPTPSRWRIPSSLAALHEAVRVLADGGAPGPQRALLICYGVGNTAKAMTDSKTLRRRSTSSTSRATFLTSGRVVYPGTSADHPRNDPRVRVHVEDGRYLPADDRPAFDLSRRTASAGHRRHVNLYTREYFDVDPPRLADGGFVDLLAAAPRDLTDAAPKSSCGRSATSSRTARCGTDGRAADDGGQHAAPGPGIRSGVRASMAGPAVAAEMNDWARAARTARRALPSAMPHT